MAGDVQADTDQIDHDGQLKELLHQCFELFLRLFFPQQAAQLDFSEVIFLEQERLTDYPTGAHRHVDTLVDIKTLEGQPLRHRISIHTTARISVTDVSVFLPVPSQVGYANLAHCVIHARWFGRIGF